MKVKETSTANKECRSGSTSTSKRGVAVVLAAPGSRTQLYGARKRIGVLLVCHIVMIMGHGSS